MDFDWSPEQLEFRQSVIDFGRSTNAGLADRERTGAFPRDLWSRFADFGVQGLPLPPEYGGTGADILTTMLCMEALGYAARDQGLLFSIHAHMWAVQHPILAFGTEQQKQRYLPRLCDGSWIGAHAMSEPDSGSDAFGLTTRAERHGDTYVLNGTKTFVSNAPVADVFLVFATVNRQRGMWGVTAFVLDRDARGLSVGNPIEKMGLTTSPMAEVILEDCEVPAENLLGREGQGAAVFNHSMGWERSCILATDVGVMERNLETSIEYANTRTQFGKPIGNFQLVASRIVDMKLRLETSRMLLYRAAWTLASGRNATLEAAMAKLHISEAAVQSALDAVHVHGGYGYMKEFDLERTLRDSVGGKLYSGASEIQRLIIARQLGLSPGS
jgi:alkylation response protein AidB-like acyl-CoA dehydrogenase